MKEKGEDDAKERESISGIHESIRIDFRERSVLVVTG